MTSLGFILVLVLAWAYLAGATVATLGFARRQNVAAKDGPVLGVHMIGPHVTDLIAEGMLIVNWEAVPAEVAGLLHPHPSLSEAVGEAFLALAGKPLNTA